MNARGRTRRPSLVRLKSVLTNFRATAGQWRIRTALIAIVGATCAPLGVSADDHLEPGQDGSHCLVWLTAHAAFGNRCNAHLHILLDYGGAWLGWEELGVRPVPGHLDFGDYTRVAQTTSRPDGYDGQFTSMAFTPAEGEVEATWRACVSEGGTWFGRSDHAINPYVTDGWWPMRDKRTDQWKCVKFIDAGDWSVQTATE